MFVNTRKELIKIGGRKAVKFTKDELLEKIKILHLKNKEYLEDMLYELNIIDRASLIFDESCISLMVFKENSTINKDLSKVCFNDENEVFTQNGAFTDNPNNLCGFHTLDNGFTFLGGMAGGDWEKPVFFIIYWDGQKLRGYIPAYGNTYNANLNTAFGSEEDSDKFEKYLKIYGISEYSHYEDMIECYCRYNAYQYQKNGEIDVDWTRIEEDVKSRIII